MHRHCISMRPRCRDSSTAPVRRPRGWRSASTRCAAGIAPARSRRAATRATAGSCRRRDRPPPRRAATGAQFSARNRFAGTVTDVKVDGLIAQVELVVDDPARVVAIVTADAVEDSGCARAWRPPRSSRRLGDGRARRMRRRRRLARRRGRALLGAAAAAAAATRHRLRRRVADGRFPKIRRGEVTRSPAPTRSPPRSARARRPTSSPRRTWRCRKRCMRQGLCSKPVVFTRNTLVVIVPTSNPAGIHSVSDLTQARREAGRSPRRACRSAATRARC